jgi:hypothetical protein
MEDKVVLVVTPLLHRSPTFMPKTKMVMYKDSPPKEKKNKY